MGDAAKTAIQLLSFQSREIWSKCQSVKRRVGEETPTKLDDNLIVIILTR
jgi:hypothetical protein